MGQTYYEMLLRWFRQRNKDDYDQKSNAFFFLDK